jgi:hypothetical protein
MDTGIAALLAATVSAIVSIIIILTRSLFLERWFHLFKLKNEYRYEQRKKIKEILAHNKVQLLNQAEELNHRIWNLRSNCYKEWHKVNYDYYNVDQRYFNSFVYRMVAMLAWIRKTEKEMCYLDATIASPSDLDFVTYLRLFQTILCDVQLFKGLEYDDYCASDHFFRNDLQEMADKFIVGGEVVQFSEYLSSFDDPPRKLNQICQFIDGINPNEKRQRWERLQAFHLVLIAFLNSYGYKFQKTSYEKIKKLDFKSSSSITLENMLMIIGEYCFSFRSNIRIWKKIAKSTGTSLKWGKELLDNWRNESDLCAN